MKSKYSYWKELIKNMMKLEVYNHVSIDEQMTTEDFGSVNGYKIELFVNDDDPGAAYSIRSVTRGIFIAISINVALYLFTNRKLFNSIIAHELGHIDLNHLDDDSTAKDYHFDKSRRFENPMSNFIRSQINIIRGDFNNDEYEADYAAIQYVPKEDIIAMQLKEAHNNNNPVTKIELINRISALLDIKELPPKKDLVFTFDHKKLKRFYDLGFKIQE